MEAVHQNKNHSIMAWRIYAVLALPYLLVYFQRVAPAVVADHLMAEFSLTGAALGNLTAIYFYIYTLMQLPSGVMADTLGARKTVFTGMIVSGMGTFVFAWAPVLTVAYLGRLLIGFGVSVIFVSILKVVSEWFHSQRFGFMSGLTLLIGNAGAILAATPLAVMASNLGWRVSFAVVGLISIFAAILCLAFVRDRPTDPGLPHPGGNDLPEPRRTSMKTMTDALLLVITNRHSWPPFIIFLGLYGTLMAFQGVWGIPYLTQHYGMERVTAASTILLVAIGMAVGSPLAGAFSDALKRRKLPLIIFTSGYILIWFMLLFWPGGKPPAGSLPFLSFFMGFFVSGFVLMWAYTKEVNPINVSGISIGFANMGGLLGAAIMQPLLGWALDSRWQGSLQDGVRIYPLDAFRFTFMIALVVLCTTAALIFILKESYGGLEDSEAESHDL